MADSLVSIKGVVITAGPEQHMRGMGPAVRRALAGAVRYWHQRFYPLHFREGADERYGYKPRSPGKKLKSKRSGVTLYGISYEQRKWRLKGHGDPLTWSGLLRRMSGLPIAVRGTRFRATGTMQVPWYVKMTPARRNAPALGRELIRTTQGEAEQMRRVVREDILASLESRRDTQVINL